MIDEKSFWEQVMGRWRYGTASMSLLLYIAFFITVHKFVGNSIAAFSVFPAMIIAGLFGLKIGVISSILLIPLDTLLFNLLGVGGWDVIMRIGGFPGATAVLMIAAVTGYLRDVMIERNRLLLELTNKSSELSMLMAALPDTLFRLASNSRILGYQAGANIDVPFNLDYIINKSYFDTLPRHLAQQVATIHQRVVLTQSPENFEFEFHVSQQESAFWLEARFIPIHNEETLVIVRDITQNRAVASEQILSQVQHERIEFLRDFIGSVSHDFKTPISVIRNNMYIIKKVMDDPERRDEKIRQVDEQTRRLERLVDDILIVSRLDSDLDADQQQVNIGRIVTSVIGNLQHRADQRGIRINLKRQQELWVIGNDLSLHQAFDALISNAIQFNQETGNININIEADNSQQHVVIQIADTGIGISQADLPHVFDHFYRADKARAQHTGGSGLGLTIAKRIIDLHRGSLSVQSIEGKGSTFTVTLPRIENSVSQQQAGEIPYTDRV